MLIFANIFLVEEKNGGLEQLRWRQGWGSELSPWARGIEAAAAHGRAGRLPDSAGACANNGPPGATSSPNVAHFIATIVQYDYDRQAALYLDVLGATRFLIIGVQKKAGPLRGNEVWRVELTLTPGLIEQGRKKYAALLRHHARQNVLLFP